MTATFVDTNILLYAGSNAPDDLSKSAREALEQPASASLSGRPFRALGS
jgi:hypothetical protein